MFPLFCNFWNMKMVPHCSWYRWGCWWLTLEYSYTVIFETEHTADLFLPSYGGIAIIHVTWTMATRSMILSANNVSSPYLPNLNECQSSWWIVLSLSVSIVPFHNYCIWRFPKKGVPPVIIHFSRMFHYKPTSYWGTHIDGNPHILWCG